MRQRNSLYSVGSEEQASNPHIATVDTTLSPTSAITSQTDILIKTESMVVGEDAADNEDSRSNCLSKSMISAINTMDIANAMKAQV